MCQGKFEAAVLSRIQYSMPIYIFLVKFENDTVEICSPAVALHSHLVICHVPGPFVLLLTNAVGPIMSASQAEMRSV